MEHHVCIGYGISAQSYSNQKDTYRGIGQGNLFSGEACKIKSCKIIKKIKNENIGAIIEAPVSKEIDQRAAIAFVNDTSFYSNGYNVESKT